MSDIDELQRRITAAMERIGAGIEGLDAVAPAADPDELDRLNAALEDERLANAQLDERIKKIKAAHAEELAAAQAQLGHSEADAEALTALDAALQKLRAANAQLRESNAKLREANEAGVGDPHLINNAMLAELESLSASRAADEAEATAIMGRLVPLLESARGLPDGEEV